jgi:hypothetical protein
VVLPWGAGILEETTNKGNRQLEKALFSHSDAVTQRFFGEAVYYRGICEFSNVCANDCGYCGIRKHQRGVRRYTMPIDEVVEVRGGRHVVHACTGARGGGGACNLGFKASGFKASASINKVRVSTHGH